MNDIVDLCSVRRLTNPAITPAERAFHAAVAAIGCDLDRLRIAGGAALAGEPGQPARGLRLDRAGAAMADLQGQLAAIEALLFGSRQT